MPRENPFGAKHEDVVDPLNPDIDVAQLLKEGGAIDLEDALKKGHFEKPEPGRYAELAQTARAVVGKHEETLVARVTEAEERGPITFETVAEDDETDLKKAA